MRALAPPLALALALAGAALTPASAASAAAPPRPRDPAAAAAIDAFPSLAYYPSLPAPLLAALAAGDPSAVLRALARAFRGATWHDRRVPWQRLAYIQVADPPGYTVWLDDGPRPLPPGAYQLGCMGAFLEAIRLLWLPTVDYDNLYECIPRPADEVECTDAADLGHSVLVHLSDALPLAAGAAAGPRPVDVTLAGLRGLLADPDHLQLCAISHRARAWGGRRFFHHLIVLDPIPGDRGAVHLFDSTGDRGLAHRRIALPELLRYVRDKLARSPRFRYDPATAALHCLPALRPRATRAP